MADFFYLPLNEGAGGVVSAYTSRGRMTVPIIGGDGTEWTANAGYFTGAAGKILEWPKDQLGGLYAALMPGGPNEGATLMTCDTDAQNPGSGEVWCQFGYQDGATNYGLDGRAQNSPVDRMYYRSYADGGASTATINASSTGVPAVCSFLVNQLAATRAQNGSSYTPGTETEIDNTSTNISHSEAITGNAVSDKPYQGIHIAAFRNSSGNIANFYPHKLRHVSIFKWGPGEFPPNDTATLENLRKLMATKSGAVDAEVLAAANMSSIAAVFNEQYDDPTTIKG